jgi:ribosomal protein S18 acetylase RimI-like enzyme
MNKTICKPWIKLKGSLNQEDNDVISALQKQCFIEDPITLKLDLDYKLINDDDNLLKIGIRDINEFMYYDGQDLIGYIGISGFAGTSGPLEITGMVHPLYRKQGVFSKLHELVLAECRRRRVEIFLALCDKKSDSGHEFLEKAGARYKFSEFEMYFHEGALEMCESKLLGVNLRKASNADASEIARQDSIYFGVRSQQKEVDVSDRRLVLPEEEERRGLTMYLAVKDEKVIGKVNLQLINGAGGIYGLGVLPENRGKGFGRAILLNAIKQLKNANASTIMLQVAAENRTALNLYKSCGFREESVMDYFELKSGK